MSTEAQKPIIGFTCGDINGIGIETIIKVLSNNALNDMCTPVVFANSKCINFYRKAIAENNVTFNNTKDFTKLSQKQPNIFNLWDEDVQITPGELNETGGKYALKSLQAAAQALKDGKINALVTTPIHKKNIQCAEFNYSGHTPFLKDFFNVSDVLMLLAAENLKVAVVTEHVPVSDVHKHITKDSILSKLTILNNSLKKDFGIDKPKIAVLGLNPHAGDEGLIGNEEQSIIIPAIQQAKNSMLVFGAYSADAFFARGHYTKFDAVLAMYHDQGLIPFKSLAIGEGVNFTAGLPVIRTSPDHGTAFDIAGKGIADANSLLQATFKAIDIYRNRLDYANNRANPLKKMSGKLFANTVDEKVEEV